MELDLSKFSSEENIFIWKEAWIHDYILDMNFIIDQWTYYDNSYSPSTSLEKEYLKVF